jgi:hypothetical protein
MTEPNIEAMFLTLCEADPAMRASFDNAVALLERSMRTRRHPIARRAGAAFKEMCLRFGDVQGSPIDEPTRRVLLELVARTVEIRRSAAMN